MRGEWRRPHLTEPIDVIIPFRVIIAATKRQADVFISDSGFYPRECKIVLREDQIRGLRLDEG